MMEGLTSKVLFFEKRIHEEIAQIIIWEKAIIQAVINHSQQCICSFVFQEGSDDSMLHGR